MAYTDIDDPTIYFNTVLYTSNSGSSPRTISGVGFQPDWVWVKNRDSADYNHVAADSVRGLNKILQPDTAIAESSNHAAGYISAANSDGFVLTAGSSNLSNYDTGGNKQVAWNWKAGTSFSNDASSTSVGTIDSTGSVSTDAGFSIINYAGTGNAGTIAHGLGAVLKMIIFKNRSTGEDWGVWHQGFPNNGYIALNTVNDQRTNNTFMNTTIPTSSVFSVGNNTRTGSNNHNFVAYCFAEKQGYSKFGNYTGSANADGPFVHTGFKPAWIMIKRQDGADSWTMYDNKRTGFNVDNNPLFANAVTVESTDNDLDILSNGFKIRRNSGRVNTSGANNFYMAFAEASFVTSTGIPATAK